MDVRLQRPLVGAVFIHNRCGPALDKAVDNRAQASPGKCCEGVVKKSPACRASAQTG